MTEISAERTVEKLLRQQAALASFGSFAFRQTDLRAILGEAARVCAVSLDVPFCKICRYRSTENDLLIEAGCGWRDGVIGRVVSEANESSPQGRAYVTGEPVIIRNLQNANDLCLPDFYGDHGIISTVDVLIPAIEGVPYGVLEIDSPFQHQYDVHDINFLTGFANVLAEAVATARRVQEINALLSSQRLLAEELQHRVANNLQMITTMLDSYAQRIADSPARDEMELITRRVATLSQVYDSLLGVGLSKTLDLAEYFRALCLKLPGLLGARGKAVEIVVSSHSVFLGVDEVTSLGMVLVECITNCYKHAFPTDNGTIAVTLSRASPISAILTIEDNGTGGKPNVDSGNHGMGLMTRLMQRIGGTITTSYERDRGTRCTIRFPAPAPDDEAEVRSIQSTSPVSNHTGTQKRVAGP